MGVAPWTDETTLSISIFLSGVLQAVNIDIFTMKFLTIFCFYHRRVLPRHPRPLPNHHPVPTRTPMPNPKSRKHGTRLPTLSLNPIRTLMMKELTTNMLNSRVVPSGSKRSPFKKSKRLRQ